VIEDDDDLDDAGMDSSDIDKNSNDDDFLDGLQKIQDK